jgi:hypothetical protein
MDQRIDSNFQKGLFEHFFQSAQALKLAIELADSNRQKEVQVLNQAREEIVNALDVYQKVESDISGLTNPRSQLNIGYNLDEKLGEIRNELEKAKSMFLLKTLDGNENAYISASNARKSGLQILQKISDYHQAKYERVKKVFWAIVLGLVFALIGSLFGCVLGCFGGCIAGIFSSRGTYELANKYALQGLIILGIIGLIAGLIAGFFAGKEEK